MSADVVAVLVVCDPSGPLLAAGRCGSTAPRVGVGSRFGEWSDAPRREPNLDGYAVCVGCGRWTPHHHPEAHDHADECQELSRVAALPWALPLWWDGSLVPEGWDRARRVDGHWPDCGDPPTWEGPVNLGARLVSDGYASRVVRLTRGAEGRLVEVTP